MKPAVLGPVLVACLLLPAIAAGGFGEPAGRVILPQGNSSGRDLFFPNISLPARTGVVRDWYERGFALSGEERYAEAALAYEQAVAADPSFLNAWYYLGDALFRQGRYDEALLAFGNATAIDPDFVDAYFYEGLVYRRLGLPKEEQEALGRGLEAADRRKAREDASALPQVPGPVPQPLSAGLAILATGITALCLAAGYRNRGH